MTDTPLTFRQQTLKAVNNLQAISRMSDSAISRLTGKDARTVSRLRRGDSIGSVLLDSLYQAAVVELRAWQNGDRAGGSAPALADDGATHSASIAEPAQFCTAEPASPIPTAQTSMPRCPGLTTGPGGGVI